MKEFLSYVEKLTKKGIWCISIEKDDDTLVADKNEQIEIWKRHFDRVMNIMHDEIPEEIPIIKRHDPNRNIDSDSLCLEEISLAIKTLKAGKDAGVDNIPVECFKAPVDAASEKLYALFKYFWVKEKMPDELKESINCENPQIKSYKKQVRKA